MSRPAPDVTRRRRAPQDRQLARLLSEAQTAELEVYEAREAEEQAAEDAALADEIGAPDDPDLADRILNAPPGDDSLFFDEFMPAARGLHRKARARVARAEARAESAKAAYYATLARLNARSALRPVHRPMRLHARAPRARSQARRVRVSAVASAGSGADGPPPEEPAAPSRQRDALRAPGGAS